LHYQPLAVGGVRGRNAFEIIDFGGRDHLRVSRRGTSSQAQDVLPEIAVSAPAPGTSADGLQRGPLNVIDDTYQSSSAITGREIQRSNAASLADLLSGLPGVSASTFAPGASRPNIRGLDDYRVRIQENGIGTQDASDFSQDHVVPVDPLAADKVEVIRGPATLRYGSQAIGGVVSATNNRIPEKLVEDGFSARFKGGASSVDNGLDGAVALDASGGNVAIHADAYGRRAGDYRIPGGVQANTRLQTEGQSVGGSYIFDGGFIGTAIQHITSLYHIPGVIDAQQNSRIDMEQTKWTSKGEWRAPTDGIDAVRFTLGMSNYKHNELGLDTNGVDTLKNVIKNREIEGRFELDHASIATGIGALTGTWGAQFGHRELGTDGSLGGLLAQTNTNTAAVFAFEQIQFTDTLRMQLQGASRTISSRASRRPSRLISCRRRIRFPKSPRAGPSLRKAPALACSRICRGTWWQHSTRSMCNALRQRLNCSHADLTVRQAPS
jgi:iron complex outermembrane receptor protein